MFDVGETKHLNLSFPVSICVQYAIHMGSSRKQMSAELQALAVSYRTCVGSEASSIF